MIETYSDLNQSNPFQKKGMYELGVLYAKDFFAKLCIPTVLLLIFSFQAFLLAIIFE